MSVASCLCGDFEFYVTYNSIATQVYPANFPETSLIDELEKDQIFYRRKFSGQLIFGGQSLKADFDYFWNIEQTAPCERIYITIYKDSVEYWAGYFATSNGHFDIDACTFSITPLTLDDYSELLDSADIEYNILLAGEISEVTSIYYNGVDTINYTHCRMLTNVIEYLFQKIVNDPVQTVDSTFFEDAMNPITLIDNHYDYLTIAQKSDIKYPTASNPATIGMLSFNQIMTILRCMNLYWDYDGSSLRIEHISYWAYSEGLDVKSQRIALGTNKYRYLNEEIPKYEIFKWMEASNADFVGQSIWYDSDCVSRDTNSNTVEYNFDVATDIQYIIDTMADVDDKESLISNDGWVLFANRESGGNLYIRLGTGPMGGTHLNIDLAWSRLHQAFFKHERQLIQGYMNGSLTTFYSSCKIRQQDTFSIISCDEFDPNEYISTELGDDYFGGSKGYVKQAVIHPYGQIDLSLVYDHPVNENTGLDEDYSYIIVEKVTGATQTTYYAILSDVYGVDVTITVSIICRDALNNECPEADDIVITAGNLTGSVVIDWCTPSDPPTCIVLRTSSTNPPGVFTSSFILDSDATCV